MTSVDGSVGCRKRVEGGCRPVTVYLCDVSSDMILIYFDVF